MSVSCTKRCKKETNNNRKVIPEKVPENRTPGHRQRSWSGKQKEMENSEWT